MRIKELKDLINNYEKQNPPDEYLGNFNDYKVLVGSSKGMDDNIEVWFDPLMGLCIDRKINAS
jgi:hypothetical protein